MKPDESKVSTELAQLDVDFPGHARAEQGRHGYILNPTPAPAPRRAVLELFSGTCRLSRALAFRSLQSMNSLGIESYEVCRSSAEDLADQAPWLQVTHGHTLDMVEVIFYHLSGM